MASSTVINFQDSAELTVIYAIVCNKKTEVYLVIETVLQAEVENIRTMKLIEVVAYVNRLNCRLMSKNCTDEERKKGLILMKQLKDRVGFLHLS
jgi:hypothetical protein